MRSIASGKILQHPARFPRGRRKAPARATGTQTAGGCVARTDAQHRRRENSATSCTLPPGAAQSA
ncbi:hypothetical protein, partial [Klebsiella michiganensis]|uniref:hypothetical protein n=1 Tax=Klebsiella michiganensis TaxID=1134687 RepID=UPI001CA5611B